MPDKQKNSQPSRLSADDLETLGQMKEVHNTLLGQMRPLQTYFSLFAIAIGVFFFLNTLTWTPSGQSFLYPAGGHPLSIPRLVLGFVISLIFLAYGLFTIPRRTTRTLMTPQAILTYRERNLSKHFDPAPVEAKLREILTALPSADLKPYEEHLNIIILNRQAIPPKPQPPPPPDPEKDIFR
jgi:hypothetical protein